MARLHLGRSIFLAPVLALGLTACDGVGAGAGAPKPAANAFNMKLVGGHDLQGRASYQPTLHNYGARTILFAGHHAGQALNPITGEMEKNGFSVLDVTDPAHPEYLAHYPPTGGEASGTQHIQVCDGGALPAGDPAKTYLLRTNGQLAQEILDVTDPAAPVFVTTITTTGTTVGGRRQTHKNQWDCASGIGYLVATVEGWRAPRVLQVFDLSDPAHPVHIRNFGIDGMQPGQPGEWKMRKGVHQPVVVGNRMYLGYESGSNGVLQILDLEKFLKGDPKAKDRFAPTPENLLYPQIARVDMPSYYGVHTAKPYYGKKIEDYGDNTMAGVRDFLITVSESLRPMCQEPRHAMFIFDITEETKPLVISTFQVPEEPGDFCHKGGRFGPHTQHDSLDPRFLDKLVLLSYFNAGIRAVDIRDPFKPVEVARYIPRVSENSQPRCATIDGQKVCKTAIQTNNVNIDDRGYIYALDRAGAGLHIVELTGEARAIVGLP